MEQHLNLEESFLNWSKIKLATCLYYPKIVPAIIDIYYHIRIFLVCLF